MKIVTRLEFEEEKETFLAEIRKGAIFIHPTDTIYGLGCDATSAVAIDKLRKVKNRSTRPFSIIAPSKEWIFDHCNIPVAAEPWLEKLPGPYTLIFKLKPNGASGLPTNLTMGLDSVGIRIPNHWFSEVVEELGTPIVTTSANLSGKDFMTHLDDLDQGIRRKMKFVIFEGEKNNNPSTMVDLTGDKTNIRERGK